ncbi:MAG: phosphatase [Isosphaeraceae bacterium]|jgi:uncharacterized protein (DUF1015 family)|nr:MAG: phosphatase [Isosphaeraceae bacterium]
MAEIHPFRAIRYDVARVGALSQVIAPPYDVIDPALQDRLYQLSPYNAIRLELNRAESGDVPGRDRYTRAAAYLRDWLRAGILRPDDAPALYVYHQIFEVDGQSHTRKGFFARVRLERFGEGQIFPHEQTLSGPKADRLKLYESTGTQLSPIFGIYPDQGARVLAAVEAGIRDRTPLEATDHLGVVNRLWTVTDARIHTVVQGLMADRPIFIADGHHRYETGIAYRDALEAAGQLAGRDDPAHFAMMMLVGMDDPGLIIQPTHRLIAGYPGLTASRLAEILAAEFDVTFHGEGPSGARQTWDQIQLTGDQDTLGFGTTADGRWLTAHLRSHAIMEQLVPHQSPQWRALGVSILHELAVAHLLKDLGTPEFRYVHRLDEVIDDITQRGCDLAALVPPATMHHVQAIASHHEKMPPKSTYFFPKILTGLVFNPLR